MYKSRACGGLSVRGGVAVFSPTKCLLSMLVEWRAVPDLDSIPLSGMG